MGAFKEPHGGEMKNLYLRGDAIQEEKRRARDLPSWDLTMRQLCDIELILNGAFSPLEGFLGQEDYEHVLENMRLASRVLWPMPITLDVTPAVAEQGKPGGTLAPRDPAGVLIAALESTDSCRPQQAPAARAGVSPAGGAPPGAR